MNDAPGYIITLDDGSRSEGVWLPDVPRIGELVRIASSPSTKREFRVSDVIWIRPWASSLASITLQGNYIKETPE